jgi:hypothetical protein
MKTKIIWIALFILGSIVRSTEIFHPIDTRSWRESDLASIARNYYRNGMDFAYPQIDWGGTGPGYTESEFPLYPFLIAISYKLFGQWDPIGRIISLVFSIGSMCVFFSFSKYLFKKEVAIASSLFFVMSPLLMTISVSIQSEPMMFFFYILAAYVFMIWVDNQSMKHYLLTLIFTSLAILCKITAINIGILFLIILLTKKGWKYLFKLKVILLGILIILPSIIWYMHSHKMYLLYGNSLGISNEYHWAGWDLFTHKYFIRGIILQELNYIWSYAGFFITLLALFSTQILKKFTSVLPLAWIGSVGLFYLITARTAADDWAFYYHVFSVAPVSMLLGVSTVEITKTYFPSARFRLKEYFRKWELFKRMIILIILLSLITIFLGNSTYYFLNKNPQHYQTSNLYACKDNLNSSIPKGDLILASGGPCKDNTNYPVAYNASYFFYWLDRKGYNICYEDQSLENINAFKDKGIVYYIAEKYAMGQKPGFEQLMRKEFNVDLECNELVLFNLSQCTISNKTIVK